MRQFRFRSDKLFCFRKSALNIGLVTFARVLELVSRRVLGCHQQQTVDMLFSCFYFDLSLVGLIRLSLYPREILTTFFYQP